MNIKTKLILGGASAAIAAAAGAFFVRSLYWQSFLLSVFSAILSVLIAIIAVNIYLERRYKKGAVKSILVLAHSAMKDMHNFLLDTLWAEYGQADTSSVLLDYMNSNGKPESIKQNARDFLYKTYVESDELRRRLENLEETLKETSRLVGWNLDADLLEACLDSRNSLLRLKSVELNGSQASKDAVTEHLLDTDIYSQRARNQLMNIADLSKKT